MIRKAAFFCRALIKKLVLSLKRFPEAVLLCAMTVSILIFMNHSYAQKGTEDMLMRICLILALGVPVVLCVKMLFETIPNLKKNLKVLIYVCSVAGLTFYLVFLLKDVRTVSMIRYIAFSIAFYLAFSFIPYLYRRENFELYVITLLSRFLVTYIYSMVLYAGFAAILFTINQLFSINISHKVYLDILLVVSGIFAPAFFLADIPQIGEEMHIDNYSKVLKVLLLYIVMPIIVIYTVILYAFFAKILVTLEWPIGVVSHLVLWYSIVSTLVIFLIYPLRTTNPWVNVFVSLLPKFIIPLLGMMFTSMGMRLKAYGMTENRYLVMVVGIWVTWCMLYHIFVKKTKNIVLPVSLALIAVLAVSGPWSCFSISKMSQNMRFEKILNKYDMVKADTINKPSKEISDIDKKEISSILSYFDRHHDLSQVKYIPKDFDMNQMEKIFGFKPYHWSSANYFQHRVEEGSEFLDINDYDYFSHVYDHVPINTKVAEEYKISYMSNDKQLKISNNDVIVYNKNVAEIAKNLHTKNRDTNVLEVSDMTFVDSSDKIKVVYVFLNMNGNEDRASGQVTIDWVEFYLFLKLGN